MMPPKKKVNRSKNRASKIHLVFDDEKRRQFLTGFHKRKLERKRVAKEQRDKDMKEERKRLKQAAKESYKNLVVSHRAIPEVEHLIQDEYQDDQVKVSVIELCTQNQHSTALEDSDTESLHSTTESCEEMPGMELKSSLKTTQKKKLPVPHFNTKQDLKRAVRKQATKNLKKSKVFQLHNKLEKQKQRKKSLKKKRQEEKMQLKAGSKKSRRAKQSKRNH